MSGRRGDLPRLALALTSSGAIAAAGYRRGSLSGSGAAAAVAIGGLTFLAGGWRWSALLLAFFGSSSALSRLESRGSGGIAIAEMAERGSRRDAVQALANGGVSALAAAASLPAPRAPLGAAFAGALAAANADTWATEIGGLSAGAPRDLISGKAVPAGTSGGVTPAGLFGAAGGGALIGGIAGALLGGQQPVRRGVAVALSGIAGSLLDSALGGTVQARYRCPHCDKATERRVHSCGTATELVGGLTWMTNDTVNLCCTLAGGALAAALTALGE